MTNDDYRTAKREFDSMPSVGFQVFKVWLSEQKKDSIQATNDSGLEDLPLNAARQKVFHSLETDYLRFLEQQITATENR